MNKFPSCDGTRLCKCRRCEKARLCLAKVTSATEKFTFYKVESPTGGIYFPIVHAKNSKATCSCEAGDHHFWSTCAHGKAAIWNYEDQANGERIDEAWRDAAILARFERMEEDSEYYAILKALQGDDIIFD